MIFWFCAVVSTRIMYGPRYCTFVLSYFKLYPDSPEYYNHIVCIFLHVCILSKIHYVVVLVYIYISL